MTDKESKLSEITIVETELSVPRKGSVRVRIDLDNRILSWRESNRWNRNFTRTINQREVNMVRREITKNDLFKSERPAVRNLEQALHLPCSWEVSIYFEDAEPFK
ncbi:MAG TPA: hypothetical protein GX717_10120, partial [Clostridiaceae bacterium]|nr:hypothetical protein [Clostridiaceae bacterium]